MSQPAPSRAAPDRLGLPWRQQAKAVFALLLDTDQQKGRAMIYYVNSPAVDYNGDGKLDLSCGNWPPEMSRLFRNDTPGGNWLQVCVEGTRMNRMGVGAQVRLYSSGAGAKRLLGHQEITLNGGYSSARPALVHFGLGQIAMCDVEVTFPSRQAPVLLELVKGNQRLTVREPRE